ncbi:MAG: DUF881 domain-containing protein [Firmicutes bacterium]|nr:DUF881 domain-containing protein [Bacillota bacterium]
MSTRAALQLAMAAVSLALGLGMGTQLRTALTIRATFGVPPPGVEELAYRLRVQERAIAALGAEVETLRARIAALQDAAAGQRHGVGGLLRELEPLRARAGMTALEGPGIVVDLADNPRPLRPGEDPNEVILHNYDLAMVLNDLWGAGAEAVAINGERIVATTGIQSLFHTFRVNSRRMTPPLQIAAIGDPGRLAEYVARRGGYLDYLRAFGFPVRVARVERVRIPAYRGPQTLSHVRPLDAR